MLSFEKWPLQCYYQKTLLNAREISGNATQWVVLGLITFVPQSKVHSWGNQTNHVSTEMSTHCFGSILFRNISLDLQAASQEVSALPSWILESTHESCRHIRRLDKVTSKLLRHVNWKLKPIAMITFIENRKTQKIFLRCHSVKGNYKKKCDNNTKNYLH